MLQGTAKECQTQHMTVTSRSSIQHDEHLTSACTCTWRIHHCLVDILNIAALPLCSCRMYSDRFISRFLLGYIRDQNGRLHTSVRMGSACVLHLGRLIWRPCYTCALWCRDRRLVTCRSCAELWDTIGVLMLFYDLRTFHICQQMCMCMKQKDLQQLIFELDSEAKSIVSAAYDACASSKCVVKQVATA